MLRLDFFKKKPAFLLPKSLAIFFLFVFGHDFSQKISHLKSPGRIDAMVSRAQSKQHGRWQLKDSVSQQVVTGVKAKICKGGVYSKKVCCTNGKLDTRTHKTPQVFWFLNVAVFTERMVNSVWVTTVMA